MIWYMLHCKKQNEWKILNICRQKLSEDALKTAFVFTYDRMRRFQGKWHLERQLMFPAFVFLESDDEATLAKELKEYEEGVCSLQECGAVLHVRESEERFLTSLCGETHHLGMSKGIIENGTAQITQGPLRGMEERICWIDRHKRLARITTPHSCASESILAGLEIVEKN